VVPWTLADGTALIVAWLAPLGETRDDRPTGAVLPFRMVNRIDGPFDGLVDKGVYSVHTFARTKVEARDEAQLTQRRMEYLVGQFTGQQRVTLAGRDTLADNVVTTEYPRYAQWVTDDSIFRYVATYRVDVRIMAA
jgi:hypothetical protein